MINGLPVTSIGDSAFKNTSLTNVIIGSAITSIGNDAFSGCTGLTSVMITNSVNNIGSDAFSDCTSLNSVYFTGNAPIVDSTVFSGDNNATVYYLTGTTSWGVTFGGVLTMVWYLPVPYNYTTNNGTITITGYTGSGSVLTLPSTITGLPVTSIAKDAFYTCSSLTSVTIPSSVTNLGDDAFGSCYNLISAYFLGNAPQAKFAFYGDTHLTVYYLPSTTGWRSTLDGRPTVLWNPQVQTSGASFGVRTNRFGFNITGTNNFTVVVEACTNLSKPVWQRIQTNTLTGGSSYFSDPKWTNYPAQFYRLHSP
jgi:hypothetical protein